MKPNNLGIFIATAALCLAAVSLQAQNSTTANADSNKVTVLQGAFQKFDWTDPVARLHLDVQNAKGEIEHWVVDGDAPSTMIQEGFTSDTMRSGDPVMVCGIVRRAATSLTGGGIALPDGRVFYFGRAADNCREAGGTAQQTADAAPAPSITPIVNSPVQPFVTSPVQPFVSSPVTAFGVAPVVARGGFVPGGGDKSVILHGVIKSVDWRDPQVAVHLEVKNGAGTTQWTIDGDSPEVMRELGVPRESLKVGEAIVVCGARPAQSAPRRGAGAGGQVLTGGGIAFADGRTQYFGGAAEDCRGSKDIKSAASPSKPAPIVNSPVQPFINPPVTAFGVDPANRR